MISLMEDLYMRTKIEIIPDHEPEEITIRCHKMTDELQEIINKIESDNKTIGYQRGVIHPIYYHDIYYFEIVDQNSFIYSKDDIYESKMKLYEFEEATKETSFFRASKSLIINADKIEAIKPSLSGRFEVLLTNGEKLIVSRQYVKILKHKMGL